MATELSSFAELKKAPGANIQAPAPVREKEVDKEGRAYVSELWWRVGQASYTNGPIKYDLPGGVRVLDLKGKMTLGEGDEMLKEKVNSLLAAGKKRNLAFMAFAPLGRGILDLPLRFLVGYRMQLFLYAKAAGAPKLGTAECWWGTPWPPQS